MLDGLQGSLLGAGIPAAVAIILYLARRAAERREMRREMACILINEVVGNREVVLGCRSGAADAIRLLGTGVYDGIVSSTNIRFFPGRVQRAVHRLYRDIGRGDERCIGQLPGVEAMLEEEACKNRKYREAAQSRLDPVVLTKHARRHGRPARAC